MNLEIKEKMENSAAYAKMLDESDHLKSFREQFYIPIINGEESVYFTGNSLGLQCKQTQDYVISELEDWANYGVEGHHHAKNPWVDYHELFPSLLTELVGAKEEEIVVMNQLTVNLHLLMATFYRPTQNRYKIICEAKAFPSDQYAFLSQVQLHGFDENAIIEVAPREGEHTLRTEDILQTIQKHGKETALLLFSGVNYYTGQVFDMPSITEAAHKAGAYCGFDLAHAAGNIPLQLHEWNVDFACWCSYKYLNSGPGGVAGVYIHEKHATDISLPRMAGWWGHDKDKRFQMEKDFRAIPTAEGWQLSNAPVMSMAVHKASLDVFAEAGVENVFEKASKLNDYLWFVLEDIQTKFPGAISILTPKNKYEHGCQVSMFMLKDGKKIFDTLKQKGVIADWREPNVIRIAPVALYNSYKDIYRFGEIITEVLSQH